MCSDTIQIPRRSVHVVRAGSGSDFAPQRLSWEMMHGASSDKSASESALRTMRSAQMRVVANTNQLYGSLAPPSDRLRPSTNHQSPRLPSLRHRVRWNSAGLNHPPFPRSDPTPIFQGEQTDAHDDELARYKGKQRAERLIHESVRMEANS
jgi:hypothetical protein